MGGVQVPRGLDEGGVVQKVSVFGHAEGIITVHVGEWVGGGPKVAKVCPSSC